ncbi:Protein kinase domain protein [Theileria parva strain Muguga]|uniref:Protein kinase domain protein n=1 Tax=Theileria parva strain Muguga TaxID=333668 RepID=UPI001C618A08|nr:Protein kinase domain protein [Theileria parva strain Muguga]EAN33118.2 Protein kinase domain protein [Theileria parva strain Muguga]
MIKCEMNKNFALNNHTDYQIQSQTNYQTTYQNIIRYTFSDCPCPINPTLYTNPNNQPNTIVQLSCVNQQSSNNQLSGVNPGLGVYSDLCDKLIYILRNVGVGIKEIHDRGLIHRDLKPDNILVCSSIIDHIVNPKEIRICDLGSAKRNNNLVNDKCYKKSTPYICSRWYRAPELLFGSTHYGTPGVCVNMNFFIFSSAFGCICAEVLLLKPLFIPLVNCDSQQVLRILDILGSPSRYELEKMLKTVPREGIKEKAKELFKIYESNKKLDIIVDNLSKGNSKLEAIGLVAKLLLRWCPKDRISISEALEILNNC